MLSRAIFGLLLLATTMAGFARGSEMDAMRAAIPSLLPSVVAITTKSVRAGAPPPTDVTPASAANIEESAGTGFVVSPDGYIVTNRHVVAGAYDIVVAFSSGARLNATIVGMGRAYDLALIKVDPLIPLPTVRLGDSDMMQIGDPVLAVGNPFGLGIAASAGIISGVGRNLHISHFDEYLQTDASINHGNSGGPLFNYKGEVIGIASALYSNTDRGGSVGIGYAIPMTDARELIPILREYGYLRVGSLEVDPEPVTAALANALDVPETGAILVSVSPKGPSMGKLQIGDIILKIGDEDIKSPHDIYRRVGLEIGHPLTLTVWRQRKIIEVDVIPVQAPEEAGSRPARPTMPVAQSSVAMRLGATVAPLTGENRDRFDIPSDQDGILVTNVDPNSPSAAAGLSVGDVVETVDMQPVSSPADGARIIDAAKAEGRHFIVALIRGMRDKHFITVTLNP